MAEEETYRTKIVEIDQGLALKSKDGGLLPTSNYRSALERLGYTFHETLGEGDYAKVKRAFCDKLHKFVAVKIISKNKLPEGLREKFLSREIALLQRLRHNSLMVLHEVYESRSNLYMVMEYLPNGDLLDYVNKVGNLSEVDGRRVFHQLLDVVSYLHEHGVYHRDIKLDNILLDEYYNIRLTDFGFARFNPSNELMSTFCGSYAYAAPEILDGETYRGDKADIWSTGVCLYGMLNGKLPFRDDDIDILRITMDIKLKFYKQVSRDCRELIRAILDTDVTSRISILDIRRSGWMCKPIANNSNKSMSIMSVRAVTSELTEAALDPYAEHGFSCSQKSKAFKSTKVTDILQSVAVNHSTGTSSISLKDVVPAIKVSSTAMAVGVRGPAGRRISVQLGGPELATRSTAKGAMLAPISESLSDRGAVNWAAALGGGGEEQSRKKMAGGGALTKFKKAATALNRFKTAVRAVNAMRKFKRGPLTTILTISQEQAMAKIISTREDQTELEMKDVRFSSSAKVADVLGSNRRRMSAAKREIKETEETLRRVKSEKLQQLGDTFAHLVKE